MDSTKHGSNLNDTAMLASWPTPTAPHSVGLSIEAAEREMKRKQSMGAGKVSDLRLAASLTSWPTPCAQDGPNGGPSQGADRLPGAVSLTNWPTPTVNDSKGSDYSYGNGDHDKICLKLPGAAKLTGWATPLASDGDKTDCTLAGIGRRIQQGRRLSSAMQARLTGWATPAAHEAGTPEQFLARKEKARLRGSQLGVSLTSLSLQAQLASWSTPSARDYKSNSGSEEFYARRAEMTQGKPLAEQAHQLVDSGPMLSGSIVETESIGRLNPELSRWLMGLPSVWTLYAPSKQELKDASEKLRPSVTPSTRSRQRSSSGASSKLRSTSEHGARSENGTEEHMAGSTSARRKALMEKLSKAKAGGVGNNFKDGKYRLAVKKMGLEDGFKGTRFQTTFVVAASRKVPVICLKENKALDVDPNPVGSDVDWMAMDLDKTDSAGPGNVRRLICDLFDKRDLSDEEYIETLAEMCDLDENGDALAAPLHASKGMLIDMETVRIITKTNKVEIVVPKWSHVPFSTYDQNAVSAWIDQVAVQAQAHQAQLAVQAKSQLPAGAGA